MTTAKYKIQAVGMSLNNEDGSAHDRRGVAAGCLASELGLAVRASLALLGMTGAESSELLGIVLGLRVCYQSRHMHSRFVLLVDSANGLRHVFHEQDPTDTDGWDLYPAIVLARNFVSLLGDLNIQVSAEMVESRRNLAHLIARSEMLYRRRGGWMPLQECWPEALPRVFQDVWRDVARNRRGEGIARNKCYNPIRYEFSEGVSSALASVAHGAHAIVAC